MKVRLPLCSMQEIGITSSVHSLTKTCWYSKKQHIGHHYFLTMFFSISLNNEYMRKRWIVHCWLQHFIMAFSYVGSNTVAKVFISLMFSNVIMAITDVVDKHFRFVIIVCSWQENLRSYHNASQLVVCAVVNDMCLLTDFILVAMPTSEYDKGLWYIINLDSPWWNL